MNHSDALRHLTQLLRDHYAERWGHGHAWGNEDAQRARDMSDALIGRCDLAAVASRVFDIAPDGTYTLHPWADAGQVAAIVEQHQHPAAPVPTPQDLTCPPWCDKPPGHPFDTYANSLRRDHLHRFGDRGSCVALELIERTADPDTHLTDLDLDPAALTIRVQYGPGRVHHLTSAGARRLSDQLLQAADLHDAHRHAVEASTKP